MKRILVIGTSRSGKTNLARRLSAIFGSSHIELDAVFWGPNWQPIPTGTFRKAFLSRSSILWWIITTYRRRKTYRRRFDENPFGNDRMLELKTPAEMDSLILSLTAGSREVTA